MTSERPFAIVSLMGSTEPLRTGQIVRYTDPNDLWFDAIIKEIDGDEAFIQYRPTSWVSYVYVWVDVQTLSIPQ